MRTCLVGIVTILVVCISLRHPLTANYSTDKTITHEESAPLNAGFAETDITPELDGRPVYMAGFGQDRQATGVHDPLKARALVLQHGAKKIALASVDVVGFFHANVVEVRNQLPGFTYVMVSSTHNHEGPDTLGLWGPRPFTSGVDPAYLKLLERQIVKAICKAEANARPVTARLGTARAPELLHDGRLPIVKHDELVAIQFLEAGGNRPVGIVAQWNCHRETLADKNTEISSDFVGPAVNYLRKRYRCPVIYFTGTVGGLMTSLHVEIKDDHGQLLPDGSVAKTERYGRQVGRLAERALSASKPVNLTPLQARSRDVFIPLENRLYVMGRKLGVFKRQSYLWQGDPYKAVAGDDPDMKKRLCFATEVGWLRFGDVEVALIPGEIYPELVLDKIQDPPDPGADFPNAPKEPALYTQMSAPHHMIIGLANDEVGYIIPKCQWDEKPPFCYGRKSSQYGEVNSVGPETAPILCNAFKQLVSRP